MKIFLVGFRGTGGFYNPKYKAEPALIKAGHIGIQFEDDARIFGFHPTLTAEDEAGGEDAIVELLRSHVPQTGCVQDDTAIFERANVLFNQGERTEVLALIYEVSEEAFQKIKQTLLEWYNIKKEFQYNFPDEEGQFEENQYNCATFPELLGLTLPVKDGRLAFYIEKMLEQGAVGWQSKFT